MRDAPIESWQPVKHWEYFAHVCSSNDTMGVGLALCHVSSGLVPARLVPARLVPARGVATDPYDGYEGDVAVGHLGEPVAGAEVIYRKLK